MVEHYLDNPQEVRDLVSDIRLAMFEYLEGHISEAQLKDELRPFLPEQKVTVTAQAAAPSVVVLATIGLPQTPIGPRWLPLSFAGLVVAANIQLSEVSVLSRGLRPSPRTSAAQALSLQW
jgi:hypothetical protein